MMCLLKWIMSNNPWLYATKLPTVSIKGVLNIENRPLTVLKCCLSKLITTNFIQFNSRLMKCVPWEWFGLVTVTISHSRLHQIEVLTFESRNDPFYLGLLHYFDPLGLLGPVVLVAEVMMQRLWQLKVNWDKSQPAEIHSQWLEFEKELPSLAKLAIPRWLPSLNDSIKFEILFCRCEWNCIRCMYVFGYTRRLWSS